MSFSGTCGRTGVAIAAAATAALMTSCSGRSGENENAPAGRLDPAFGVDGVYELAGSEFAGISARANSVSVDGEGRLLLAGWSAPPPAIQGTNALFVRVLRQGTLDAGFGGTGYYRVAHATPHRSEGRWAFPVANGRTIVVEARQELCLQPPPQCTEFLTPQVEIRRLLADGSIDAIFGSAGVGPLFETQSLPQADHSVFVLGGAALGPPGQVLLRLLSNDVGGFVAFANNADAAMACEGLPYNSLHRARMARLASGKLLVARMNTSASGGVPIRKCIVRLDADGSLDKTFGTAGRTFVDDPALALPGIVDILERPDGGLALVLVRDVVGQERSGSILWLTASGAIDTARGNAGVTGPLPGLGAITSAAMQPDGKIVLAGWPYDPLSPNTLQPFAYDRPRLVRLEATGNADTTFGDALDGIAPLISAGRFLHPLHVAVAPDGAIFVAGFSGAGVFGGGEATRLAVAKVIGGSR